MIIAKSGTWLDLIVQWYKKRLTNLATQEEFAVATCGAFLPHTFIYY